MEINDYFLRYILTSVYSTKNLIISPPGKEINIFVKELIKKISNVSTEFYKKNKISIVLIKSQKIKDTIFVNSETLKTFLNELKAINIPESIIKEYSLTILNNQKRTTIIKEEKWRRIIFPKIQYSTKKNKKIVNNKYYNYNLSDYFIKKSKIFKISKNNINNNRNEKYKELNNKKNFLLLGKKRNLSYNDLIHLTKEKNNNQLSSSVSSINIDENAFQYIPSLFTTSPSLLNNNENNDIDYNINNIMTKSNENKIKEESNKKRGVFSTLKDVSRETLFFLIQKQNTTIEEITKYIFNIANLKTVHGKAQTYNNIQRRVYDTINVLQGLNKIEKKGFLQIHYILSEKEKKEIIIMKKQKELIIKLYLLYATSISNMNYKSFYKNLKNYLNYNYLLMNKEQYLTTNEILEYTKERILEFSRDISEQIYDYINEKNLLNKFRIYLLKYDKLLCKLLQNEKNKDNKSSNNIEEDKNTTNNINTSYSKINTNDSSINHQKETFFDIYKNNNENDNIESPLNNNGSTNINNINLLNVNKFQNLNQIYFNNNNSCFNNINNANLNSLNNNNFFNFISDY